MDGSLQSRVAIHQHDDALGRWTVATCQPCPALRPHVSTLWFGEGQVSYRRDRILPTGDSFLLINLGPTQYLIEPEPPQRRVPFRDIWYSGLHERPIETEAPNGNRLLGVAFRACGARAWLHCDGERTAGQVLALTDLLGDRVLDLREQLLNCTEIRQCFARVEAWLLDRLDSRRQPHALVPWALTRIGASTGHITVAELAAEARVSRKYLTDLFRRDVGLGPKTIARIERFKAALTLLGGLDHVPWAELAGQCGYYDQSHLIRDFRAFSGFAPGEFVGRSRPDSLSVVVE